VRRAVVLAFLALTAAVVAGCGSSGDQTSSFNGQVVTVPGDVHDVYGEIEAFLAQFPYQAWYTKCVVTKVKKELKPQEAEALESLPESSRAGKAEAIIAAAGPACLESSKRPVIDPNASEKEFDLYRSGFVEPMRKIAEEHEFGSTEVACVEEKIKQLAVPKILALGNGSHKVREVVLLAVLSGCAKAG
jgi:hypothetical protein